MDYLFTRPQLRKLMIEYLNDFLNHCSVSEYDSFIVVDYNYDAHNWNDNGDDVAMEYDSDDGRLYIDKDFLDKFSIWFPLDMKQSKSFIEDWFENMFNVKIKYVAKN